MKIRLFNLSKADQLSPYLAMLIIVAFSIGANIAHGEVNDTDMDGVLDLVDNCSMVANADQLNTNDDRYGNACDPDINNDEVVNYLDLALWQQSFNSTEGGDTDFNGDGVTNFVDFAVFPPYFFGAPGPSGVTDQSIELVLALFDTLTPSTTLYRLPVYVEARDVYGEPVPDLNLSLSILTTQFRKGYWCIFDGDTIWSPIQADICPSEDVNSNGLLDPGEDVNNNGNLEPGNVAFVAPTTVTTLHPGGIAPFAVYYLKEYGQWLDVTISARASFQGVEYIGELSLELQALDSDLDNPDERPPGRVILNDGSLETQPGCFFTPDVLSFYSSPFGYNSDCTSYELNF